MNTTQTFNTNSVFTTKEEYVAFRNQWKQLHSEGYHNRVRNEYSGGMVYNAATGKYENIPGFTMDSPLSAWHHLAFNFAIGRTPPVKAFGDRTERKVGHLKPQLYYTIRYGVKDFSAFGDTLTEDQKAEISARIETYLNSL